MVIPEDEKTPAEKLQEEIIALKTRIKNTEYDLQHMFKGNTLLEQKLKNSHEELETKQNLLLGLSEQNNKAEEIKDFEEEITDKQTTPVSEQQEEKIKQEIEKEFV